MFTGLMSFGNPPFDGDFLSRRTFIGSKFANYSKRRKIADEIFERANENQAFKRGPKNFEKTNEKREFLKPTAKNPT